ncbi:MAG: hypothetical protein IJB98_03740 [Clostridia bacterium]|nr:hypothetical protein [Clostridia bacterium]
MSVFQIIAVCILGAGTLVALGFLVAFIVESTTKVKKQEEEVAKPQKNEEVSEIDLDAMLAQLEAASKSAKKEEAKEEVKKEEKVIDEVQPVVEEPIIIEETVEEVQPVVEEPVQEVVEETIVEEVVEEPVVEEVIEEPVKEVVVEKKATKEERKDPEVIVITEKVGPEFDYRVRLEKIKDSQARIDRDLEKTTRAIMKYERTIRRKERNQKMLDRRALELTNLNLLMYSVTDIKNVDAEKKARQEELTAHIAELKASIQDAENYLETNKEKHENNLKLRDYLSHEKTRYADEVKELEALIASGKYFDDDANGGNK